MDNKQRQALAAIVAGMSREEVNKLYKQASVQRKRMRRPSEGERQISLDDIVFKLLHANGTEDSTAVESGTVEWVGPKTARILGTGRAFELAGQRAAVGDEVEIGLSADGATWKLRRISPRRTSLSRPDVGNAHVERVIVANVDKVVIVVSVSTPPLHPRLIDRYLIAILHGGAQPALCVNKLDLLVDPSELEVLRPYEKLGVPVVFCSTTDGRGIDDLYSLIRGQASAFVGHSGVGKSSVMNAIFPDLRLETGVVMKGYGRGAHTTTASQMVVLEDGTRLIDTPGVRSFGLWDIGPERLKQYFPEFDGIGCKYRDCSHSHEPGCGVREATESGVVDPFRYETYLRLLSNA